MKHSLRRRLLTMTGTLTACAALCAAGALSAGCAWSHDALSGMGRAVGLAPSQPGTLALTSQDRTRAVAATLSMGVFRAIDEQTADIYLTDLPPERVRDGRDMLTDLGGHIVHIHLFLIPRAGDTPIDQTACNVTVRHLLIAGDARSGLYGGGAFMEPSDSLSGDNLAGRLVAASHRLVRGSTGFRDQLGVAGGGGQLEGSFRAVKDDQAVRELAAKFEALSRDLRPTTAQGAERP
jgi:hypothetical protein